MTKIFYEILQTPKKTQNKKKKNGSLTKSPFSTNASNVATKGRKKLHRINWILILMLNGNDDVNVMQIIPIARQL